MMLESRRLLLIYRYGCCYRRTASVIIAAEAQEEQHQSDLQGKKKQRFGNCFCMLEVFWFFSFQLFILESNEAHTIP